MPENHNLPQCGWEIAHHSEEIISSVVNMRLTLSWLSPLQLPCFKGLNSFLVMFNFTVPCSHFSCPQAILHFFWQFIDTRELLGLTQHIHVRTQCTIPEPWKWPSLILLFTLVLFLRWHAKMSPVKKAYCVTEQPLSSNLAVSLILFSLTSIWLSYAVLKVQYSIKSSDIHTHKQTNI